jgi:hypothetical protein
MMTRTALPERGTEGIARLYGRAALAAKSRESAFLDGRGVVACPRVPVRPSTLAFKTS